MTTKKDAKKKRRAKKRKDKRKEKSAQALFIEKMKKSNDLPGTKMIVDPEGEEKMSAVILDFAKPLLDECEDKESERRAVGLAVLVWNVSLFPEKDQDRKIQKLCSDLSPSNDATDFGALMPYINMLLERKKTYYPDIKRAIVNYQMSGSGKYRRLDVASTLSP